MRWRHAVTGLAIGGLLLTACGGAAGDASQAKTASPTPAPATSSTTVTPDPDPFAAMGDSTAKWVAPSSAAASGVERYMKDAFGDASWFPSITGYTDQGGQTWVATSIYPDGDAAAAASSICSAVSSYQIAEAGGFTGVRVAASTGLRQVWRQSITDSCS